MPLNHVSDRLTGNIHNRLFEHVIHNEKQVVPKVNKRKSFLGGRGVRGWGLRDWGKLPVAAGVFVATETGSGLVLALMEHGQKL